MYTDNIKTTKQNPISAEIDFITAKPVRFQELKRALQSKGIISSSEKPPSAIAGPPSNQIN